VLKLNLFSRSKTIQIFDLINFKKQKLTWHSSALIVNLRHESVQKFIPFMKSIKKILTLMIEIHNF